MSREWKPGDVAMVRCSDGSERIAICGRRYLDDGVAWVFQNNGIRDAETTTARPLVVIDPEDKAAVCRFVDELTGRRSMPVLERLDILDRLAAEADAMQAALREFADPKPRIEEPRGLGACVVDAAGLRWVRVHPGGDAWFNGYGRSAEWSEITAAEVLSDGVTE